MQYLVSRYGDFFRHFRCELKSLYVNCILPELDKWVQQIVDGHIDVEGNIVTEPLDDDDEHRCTSLDDCKKILDILSNRQVLLLPQSSQFQFSPQVWQRLTSPVVDAWLRHKDLDEPLPPW